MKTEETVSNNNNKSSQTVDRLFREKLADREHAVNMESAVVFQYVLKKRKRKQNYSYWLSGLGMLLVAAGIYLWQGGLFQAQTPENLSQQQLRNNEDFNQHVISDVQATTAYERGERQAADDQKDEDANALETTNTGTGKTANINGHFSKTTANNSNDGHSLTTITYPDQQQLQNSHVAVQVNKESIQYIQSHATTRYGLTTKTPPKTKITVLPVTGNINTRYSEYAPVINADGSTLFYTARMPTANSGKKKKSKLKESIFLSKYNPAQNTWGKPVSAPYPLNKKYTFASAVGLSNDGQQLFVYQDDENGNGDIYISKLNGSTWSELQKLPEPINTKYLETTVSLSPDGQVLFIASNRPGGYGGLDLWSSHKNKDGSWETPVNLGPEINSPENEEGVYIHPDGKTLYFHSNGHKGMGGYDIYYSNHENGKWSEPINMGPQINSPDDDVYFTIDAAKTTGYFASRRKSGKGETDIYKVIFRYPQKTDNRSSLTLFKGKVLDKRDRHPLEAGIEIIDLDKNETINTLSSNTATGKFMMSLPAGKNYAINIHKTGYLFYSESFLIDTTGSYNEVEKTILLDKLISGAKVVLNNIFYDYDKATLREHSKTELIKVYELMVQNPHLTIELSSYTDSRGSDAYNLKLSQQRAQSCLDYLIGKGISKDRLIAKGYGETQPVITDEEINNFTNERDREAAYQKNRRTEIKIIENKEL